VREFRGQRQMTIPSQFLAELPEGPIEVRDLTDGMAMTSIERFRRTPPIPRPSGSRYMTAADLMNGGAASESPSFPPSSGDALNAFQPGVSVIHPEYGLGRIVAVDGAGPNRKGRVAFATAGEKTFVLSKSPLRAVKR
jgi:DNA helicase-2/ATP-dependent DNA helicase PcrA